MTQEYHSRRILRMWQVEAIVGRRKTQIYSDIASGTFPKPIPLGPRASGWLAHEVEAWIDARTAERDAHIARHVLPPAARRRKAERSPMSELSTHRKSEAHDTDR
jgi:prophage regulatory protein